MCLTAPACLTSSQTTRLQKDLDDVKKQVFQIQQETAAAKRSMDEVTAALAGRKDEATAGQAGMQATLQTILDQMQALSEQVRQLNARVSALSADSPRSGGRASGGTASQADQEFKTAYADYSKGSYDMAISGFGEFLKSHPAHADAQQAQYWIGECLFSQRRYIEAIEAFDKAATRYPGGDRAAVASLKKGLAQIEAGQTSQGVTTLQKVVQQHPSTEESRLAADRLRQLGLRSSD